MTGLEPAAILAAMPLFQRPDGELVTDESPVRRMIPYLMRGRNESAIYHDEYVDLSRTKPWLAAYNRHHQQAATLFHLFLWGYGRTLHTRPGMNRFVSGGRIYQRKGAFLSFAAKKRMSEKEPLVTVKMEFFEQEPFTQCLRRIVDSIDGARGDGVTMVDKELKLALALPGPLLRLVMAALRGLDAWNLMPASMIRSDPMFASIFVANLGSLGLDNTYHHLYEYGNVSLFSVLGVPKKHVFADASGKIYSKDAIQVRWSFDERITDAFYCSTALRAFTRVIEDPEKYVGPPDVDADKVAPSAGPAATAPAAAAE